MTQISQISKSKIPPKLRKLEESDFVSLGLKPSDSDYEDLRFFFDYLLMTGVCTTKPAPLSKSHR